MTKFEQWVARWLARSLLREGDHRTRLVQMFELIRAEAGESFTEDNEATLTGFLHECFDTAIENGNKFTLVNKALQQ